jgi:hypothetical protein
VSEERATDNPKLLEDAVWSILTELYASGLPGEIASFNDENPRLVNVQPQVKTKNEDGEVVSRPQIVNAPLIWPGGGGFTFHSDIKVGEPVYILWSMRSHSRWIELGREVDPKDGRKFHCTDGVCFPKAPHKNNQTPIKEDAAFFGLDDLSAGFTVNDDGSLNIDRDSTDLIESIINHAQTAGDKLSLAAAQEPAVVASSGNWQPAVKEALNAAATALQSLSDDASNLK